MNYLILYLLKVSAGITLMYFGYLLFFRKDTFYIRNRIFLILTLLLPAILPAVKVPVYSDSVAIEEQVNSINSIIVTDTSLPSVIPGPASLKSFDYNALIGWIYFSITGILLLRVLISLLSTYNIIRKGAVKIHQFPKVIVSGDQHPPFSFFPYAVIPEETYKCGNYSDILKHEFAHIRQGHTFDLLLAELFVAFQWFNPFVWLVKRAVLLNHEFLADQFSLINNKGIKEYQYRLLSQQPGVKSISLAHSFNNLIKNRIVMINKKPTRKFAALKNILVLPIVAVLVYAFTTPEYRVKPSENSVNKDSRPIFVEKTVKGIVVNENGKPLPMTSIQVKGTTIGTSTDNQGRFTLKIQEDATLIFTYIGYKFLTIKPDFINEMNIKMVRETIAIDAVNVKNSPLSSRFIENDKIPLFVLDEVVIGQKEVDKIKPDDIRNITVLKDNQAFGKYGEKGRNGAVEIRSRNKSNNETTETKSVSEEITKNITQAKEANQFIMIEEMPSFKGGSVGLADWLESNLVYPADALKNKINGTVVVQFIVDKNGKINNPVVVKSVNPSLDKEAVRVVTNMPAWKPGKQHEEPVDVLFSLPVVFNIKQ